MSTLVMRQDLMRRTVQPPVPVPADHEFGRLELLLRLRRNPLTIWRRQHFQDRIVAGKSLLGYGVVLSDPAAIRHVLVENVANYRKDDLQRAILAPGLGEGLLTVEGEAWKRARRTLAPLFTPRRVAALARKMLPPIEAQVARMAGRRRGRIVDISQDMTRLTYDVLAETLFSNSIAGGAAAFGEALTRYFETQGRIDPLDVLGAPSWLPRIGRIRSRPAVAFFENRVESIIADRQALRRAGAPIEGDEPPDLLSALLDARDPETGQGLSDAEIGANIVTFIGAGHETTANALTWTLYLLSLAPEIREQVEAEADAVAGDPAAAALGGEGLAMTRAVIEEAMRLYPPVPSLSRAAIADDEVGGVAIPKGALVIVAPYVLHRHETLWEEPASFRPERFLPGARERIDRYAYLPFGAGPRICIGQQFAMVEAVLALSLMVRALRFDHAGDRPPRPIHQITLRPDGGMPMKVTPRR
ncbi:cytochrome P450 [Bosea sp. Leaf344]|uniref:cytochrome P450 n=1 Tax=Bosea sp. Leaf344 TaxID=1736346 RepID=UPI0006FAB380|nr:cytochrome P450 [Bosea sp. Leaf344]KQU54637.1 cytochrome P450 [Bosea sp. Leaf344]